MGVILAVVSGTIILDKVRTVNVESGGTLVMGATRPQWRSRWFDLGSPDLDKKSSILDITRKATSGTLTVTTHEDFADATIDTISLALGSALGHYPTSAQGAVLQLRFSEPYTSAGTEFELIDIVWKVQVTDSW